MPTEPVEAKAKASSVRTTRMVLAGRPTLRPMSSCCRLGQVFQELRILIQFSIFIRTRHMLNR